VNLAEDSSILALRNYMSRAIAATSRSKITADLAVALTIKAWNAYREGDPVRALSYRRGGASPETFPTPV